MIRLICLIILIISASATNLRSQNLVRNNSFENFLHKPKDGERRSFVPRWQLLNHVYGIFYTEKGNYVSGYRSYDGYQLPHTGKVYVSITNFGIPSNSSIWLHTRLRKPLLANKEYYIEYYVSRADYAGIANEQIDAFLFNEKMTSWDSLNLFAIEPTFRNPIGIIQDSVGWTKISGVFTAHGGEEYLVLGRFDSFHDVNYKPCDFDKRKRKKSLGRDEVSIYFLDDILIHPHGWMEDTLSAETLKKLRKEDSNYKEFSTSICFLKNSHKLFSGSIRGLDDLVAKCHRTPFNKHVLKYYRTSGEDEKLMARRVATLFRYFEMNKIILTIEYEEVESLKQFDSCGKTYTAGVIDVE